MHGHAHVPPKALDDGLGLLQHAQGGIVMTDTAMSDSQRNAEGPAHLCSEGSLQPHAAPDGNDGLPQAGAEQLLPRSNAAGPLDQAVPASALCSAADAQRDAEARAAVAEGLYARAGRPARWLPVVLREIVGASSQRQALAGLLATGPARSLWYVGQKLRKRWSSLPWAHAAR